MSIEPRFIPFRVGGPIQDPANFVGRREVLQEVSHAMLNLQNISLHGERRTGKTSLLLYLAYPAPSSAIGLPKPHIPVYFNFQEFAEASVVNVWQAMANAIAEQIKQRYPDRRTESEVFLDTMAKFLASSEAPELFGTGLGRALSYLDVSGLKIHLLLDEFEQTLRNPGLGDSFYDALRSLPTRAENISYVIATRTGLAALQPRYNKISSPFFNIFSQITLGPFNEDEAHFLIFSYFARAGLDISLAEKLCTESPFLYDVTGYHPFFLQMLCYHLCASLDNHKWPFGNARQQALRAFEKDSKEHFEFYWKVSSKEEQELLEKLALGRSVDWDHLRHVVRSLQDRCLIVQAESDWQLVSSAFARWIEQLTLQDLYTKAEAHLEARKWKDATRLLEEIISIGGAYKDSSAKLDYAQAQSRLQNLYKQVDDHFRREDWDQAIQDLNTILRKDPDYPGAADKLEEAKSQKEIAALYYAGVGFLEAGRLKEAIDQFREINRQVGVYKDVADRLAKAQRQKRLNGLFKQGTDHLRRKEWQEAARKFGEVSAIDPNYRSVQVRLKEAERQLRIEELHARGEANIRTDNWQEAVEVFEQLRELDRRDDKVITKLVEARRQLELDELYREGEEYLRRKKWRKARNVLENVTHLDPDYRDAVAKLNIAREHLSRGKSVTEILRDPSLQGVGVIVALIALIISIISLYTSTPTSEPVPLCNGDFEDSFECWQHGGEMDQSVECDGDGCFAVLGNPGYKCEGGVPVGEAWIKQSFQVPDTISPTLSLRYRVFSYDLDNYDSFLVKINGKPVGEYGNTKWETSSCDREAWDSGWQFVDFDLRPYIGEEVELSLHDVNGQHGWWNTWTYVDDLEVH
jgi:outer membrane protein assembly factor BamD (BamD/ComL family)